MIPYFLCRYVGDQFSWANASMTVCDEKGAQGLMTNIGDEYLRDKLSQITLNNLKMSPKSRCRHYQPILTTLCHQHVATHFIVTIHRPAGLIAN